MIGLGRKTILAHIGAMFCPVWMTSVILAIFFFLQKLKWTLINEHHWMFPQVLLTLNDTHWQEEQMTWNFPSFPSLSRFGEGNEYCSNARNCSAYYSSYHFFLLQKHFFLSNQSFRQSFIRNEYLLWIHQDGQKISWKISEFLLHAVGIRGGNLCIFHDLIRFCSFVLIFFFFCFRGEAVTCLSSHRCSTSDVSRSGLVRRCQIPHVPRLLIAKYFPLPSSAGIFIVPPYTSCAQIKK